MAFDTMLRRRLRSGAAPVAACAGFDFDAASAYLEGALGGSHRADYESHLAGCVTCRRHLIELSRLAQCAPFPEAQPAAPNKTDRLSPWVRWKEALAARIDLSSWNFKWPITGATGAVFAILIAALGAQSWRQSSRQSPIQSDVVFRGQATQSSSAGLAEAAQPLSTPDVEVSTQNAEVNGGVSVDQNSTQIYTERLEVPAPAPLVGPQVNNPNVPIEARNGALALSTNLPGEPPVATAPTPTPSAAPEASWHNPPPHLDAIEEFAPRVTKANVNTLRHSPPLELNPMKSESPKPYPRGWGRGFVPAPQALPDSESGAKPSPTSRLKSALADIKRLNPIKWPFSSESEQKPDQESQDSVDNGMVWRHRGRVFVYDKGTWIDQEYKPEMQEWRCWTLTRNSEQYKQVLADEPQLKEFFDRGPILIVWKNQIYKVLK
ncbi:MAG TPA: zf-HC2 domain-containing protein [Blastocatellia bacterium]|nr:zf-HC2 domain-containing protein [Blastocatellia bacterium]